MRAIEAVSKPRSPCIYLDHQASAPVREAVLDAMLPWLRSPANAHARHSCGARARDAVEQARDQVAKLVGARSGHIIFTSGATEATNIALRGLPLGGGSRCVTSTIEHPSVRATLADLARSGIITAEVPVGAEGVVDIDALCEAVEEGTDLVSLMAVNNEVGTIQPYRKAAGICRAAGIVFHSDMTQALGRLPLELADDEVGLASFSAHKMGGPQGVGALFVGDGTRLAPVSTGGGQEDGLRPGTVPTALVVGFGAACDLAGRGMAEEERRLIGIRDGFLAALRRAGVSHCINGSSSERIPANLSLRLEGVDADALIDRLHDVCISTGSACRSGAFGPSHVLTAMGLSEREAASSIRVGFGRYTTLEDVERAARRIAEEVPAARPGGGAAKRRAARVPEGRAADSRSAARP